MKTLQQIQSELKAGQFDLSRHALHRVVERDVARDEIREAGVDAEIVENYPEDKYSPSVLLLGFTESGRAFAFSGILGGVGEGEDHYHLRTRPERMV